MNQESSFVGLQFKVLKPDTWFPSDFTVLRDEGAWFQIRVDRDRETYLVAKERFQRSLGTVFG